MLPGEAAKQAGLVLRLVAVRAAVEANHELEFLRKWLESLEEQLRTEGCCRPYTLDLVEREVNWWNYTEEKKTNE